MIETVYPVGYERPMSVSRRQALQAIYMMYGMTQDDLEERVRQIITDPTAQYMLLVEIRASQTFDRDRPVVSQMCKALGWSKDALFATAASLE